ncbi:MAG TPA: hypothetical protein VFR81_12630 [Longimicrobium sp.]|nr:hypothetical protein [Longimicrobium sp.]
MRKLALDLDAINVESFDATPRALHPSQGTIEGYDAEAVGAAEEVQYSYYRTCRCVPYTQDMAYPECVCDLSRTCPTYDFNCPVEEETAIGVA